MICCFPQPQRSYTRRKKVPEFLKRHEEPGSDSDEDDGRKVTTRTKKKPDIEKV
jgi:hypothetical protein